MVKRHHLHANESSKSEDIKKNVVVDSGSIQLKAYQIFNEKGGSALDNWLEAEQFVMKG